MTSQNEHLSASMFEVIDLHVCYLGSIQIMVVTSYAWIDSLGSLSMLYFARIMKWDTYDNIMRNFVNINKL